MKRIDRHLIQMAINLAIRAGETPQDQARLARIEAFLRDALGEDHGVWQWRVHRNDSDNDAGIVFRLFPSGMTPDEATSASDKLWAEHEAEAERRGAEFYNYGWGQGDHDACSKTSLGILTSVINPGTMTVTHYWPDR